MVEILTGGASGARSRRRELIELTVQAWHNKAPKYAKEMVKFVRELTKVEVNDGKWKLANGMRCRIRLPSDLFYSLRQVFSRFLPGEPLFGDTDDDIDLLLQVIPEMDGNARRNRGRKARK